MRKFIITFVALTVIGTARAEQPEFENAIGETLALYQDATTVEDLQQVLARFQRIARVESHQWLAHYYVAFTAINICFKEQDNKRKDAILDEVQLSIDKAFELNGDKSELYTLQAYLYQGRIGVSPTRRGQTYSGKAGRALKEAINENPGNPRAHYLLGMNVYNTPSFFGGGSKNALVHFQKAHEIYARKNSNNSGIMPVWGSEGNHRMLENCLGN